MKFEFFVGWRYLSKRKRNFFLSAVTMIAVLGVAVSVMTVIVVLAVMNGFGRELEEKITGNIAPVTVESYAEISDYEELARKISRVEDVSGVSPYLMRQGLIRHRSRTEGAAVMGIDPRAHERTSDLSKNMKAGSFDLGEETVEFSGTRREVPGILIGKTLAARLGAGVGSKVYCIGAGEAEAGMSADASVFPFAVRGIFDTGMHEYDSSLVYIPLSSAQELFLAGDIVDGLQVRVEDIYRAQESARRISEALGGRMIVTSWIERHSNLFSALALEKKTMFTVMSLIVAVAAFNIMSTLVMMVMEKTKDIGVLKAIGAGRLSVMKIFVLEGLFIGAAGVLLGSAGGGALCWFLERYPLVQLPGDIYIVDTLPVSMSGTDMLMIGSVAFFVSVAAAIYPAVRASRLNPVEALKYE